MERTEAVTRTSAPERTLEGSYLDWPAIFGGTVVALAVGSVFAAFGAAVGLSTISARPGAGSFDLMMIISAIWIVVSLVASYMAGGYIAGRMRRRVEAASADEVTVRDGVNGLVVWGLGVIVTAVMLQGAVSAALSAAGTAASAVGSAAGTMAEVAGDVAGGAASNEAGPLDFVTRSMLRPDRATGQTDMPDYTADVGAILANAFATGEISDSERAYLDSAVAAQTGLAPNDASARVDQGLEAVQKAKATVIEAAETARISGVLSGFLLAAAALVAAVAAHGGAVRGGRHRDEGRIFGGFAHRRTI